MKTNRSISQRYWVIITVILPVILLGGCISKETIKIPLSDPLPHPKLAQMRSLPIEEKDGVIYFGKSNKCTKRAITIISLKGEPYEVGYAHGVLLKDEMMPWIKEALYWMKAQSFGTSRLKNVLLDRAKEVEQYIPEKYKTELKGLAAGSGIDYHLILMINTASTTGWRYLSCTSVAVKGQDGKIIRSRGLEFQLGQGPEILKPKILIINQPSQGYAFASVTVPGLIGVWTAMNETGLNLGTHAIAGAPFHWKGMPYDILYRKITENASSVEEVGEILEKARRSLPQMIMVTDVRKARNYEFDSANVGFRDMDEDGLVLTNFTQVLDIGMDYHCRRYLAASSFLNDNRNNFDIGKILGLVRNDAISCIGSPNTQSYHSAIFVPETLDFWIAVGPSPANRGRWVGFNLKKEIDGSGHDPHPLIIPAMSEIITATVKINEAEPWTGKWKVESNSQGGGIWAMKQEAEIVKSTRESAYEFKGKIRGNQLKGKLVGASGSYDPFMIELLSDSMSFKGTVDMATGRTNHLRGKRIE